MDLTGVVLDRFAFTQVSLLTASTIPWPWQPMGLLQEEEEHMLVYSIVSIYLFVCNSKITYTMIMYIHIWSYIIIKNIMMGLQWFATSIHERWWIKLQQTTHATKGSSDVAERFGWPWVQTDLRCTLLRVGSSFNQQGMLWILILS